MSSKLRDRVAYLEVCVSIRDAFAAVYTDEKPYKDAFKCVYCGVVDDPCHPAKPEDHGCICPKRTHPITGPQQKGGR